MAFGNSAPATLLKSPREIDIMARGGAILHATLMQAKAHVRAGISTLELDQVVESFIRSHAGAEPAFKGLYGFPGSACISINEEIVHGIPSRKRLLNEGDIVTVDVGVKLEGMYTDAAITIPVGQIDAETQRLLDVTQRSLEAGIAAATPDNHVGDIGAAVQTVVEAAGFGVVRELVGHAVGFSPHEELQIPNYGQPKRGKKLSVGRPIAIEPMVNVG
ncbi:type I methionyl aminopeptidase, partial [Gemmatimonas sp.]|uniref:type I methionyl aminopeptidase n=1 Tax=Gemmatimonas sp. TaxID=1962908 RepID=UPI0039197664